jgi:hypothetical protein
MLYIQVPYICPHTTISIASFFPDAVTLASDPRPAVLKHLTFGTKISNAHLILQGALRFWNYNKNFLEAAKGVRHARVVYRGVEVWAGDVTRADAYCHVSSVLILLYI